MTTPRQPDLDRPEPQRGERNFLRGLLAELGKVHRPNAVPFGDDMAELPVGTGLLSTVDMLMDGVDFDSATHSWRLIGRKALAVNLSDCAAMAARPVAALCAVALHDDLSMESAFEIHRGMSELGARSHCPIVGGDTNSWKSPTVISVTVIGTTDDRRPVLRSGGRPGDLLFVTGRLGGSILGRHLAFEPRVDLAIQLATEASPHAMIDISDGLSVDLGHICDLSHCGAIIESSQVHAAIHADALKLSQQTGKPPIEHALHDGEDFELIVAVDPSDAARCARLGLLPIGELVGGDRVLMRESDGKLGDVPRRGWEHFR